MNTLNPLVSVIVVTYNSSGTVIETLDSVFNQSYENIELIITDDCSVDNTLMIVKDWLNIHSKRFVRTELLTSSKNTGISPNCNRGLDKAVGKWIKFIAGDDILHYSCISRFVQEVNKLTPEPHFLVCNKSTFSDKVQDYNSTPISKILATSPGKQLVKYTCEIPNIAPLVFCRRETIINVGSYDESYLFLEDLPFYFKALTSGYFFSLVEEDLVFYRISAKSISNLSSNPSQNLFQKDYHRFINVSLIPFLLRKWLPVNTLYMYQKANLKATFRYRDILLHFTRKLAKLERRLIYGM